MLYGRKDLGWPSGTVKKCILCNKRMVLSGRFIWFGVEVSDGEFINDEEGGWLDFSIVCNKCATTRKDEINDALKLTYGLRSLDQD